MTFGRFVNLVIAVAFIVVGIVLLLSNFGYITTNPFTLIAEFWPLILIALGLYFLWLRFRPGVGHEAVNLSEPLGDITRADVAVEFGAGELTINSLGESDKLIEGSFRYKPSLIIDRTGTQARVTLKHQEWPWATAFPGDADNWRIGLATRIPLNIRINTGASRVYADFSGIMAESIELYTGASTVTIRLPERGVVRAVVEGGAANIRLEIPQGVTANIVSTGALSSVTVDVNRFPKTASGYKSPDYDTAVNKADIKLSTGMASVTVA